nr:hypothetical protein [Tanacetum cinerariifolium]
MVIQNQSELGSLKEKDTQIPQPSGPTENVADEAIHKELGNKLVRVATTASSLEAEQDSDNITKTQSKATPNESSSQRTNSGGGPRCQETMGDITPKTRFESVSKHSNDSLLVRGNTLNSDENRLKLDELMALCTNLQNKVLDLEKIKTSQRNEINSLKGSRSLKREIESLGEDASKQERRIDAIDVDDEITLVNDADKEMFDVDDLGEITLAQALKALKTLKPNVKWIVFQDPGKSITTPPTVSLQQSQDKGKRIMIEEPVKPKKKDQIRLDEEVALKLQVEFDEEERLSRERATLFQQLLEKKRKHFAAKRAEEKRNKPPPKAQQKKIMCTYLKSMEGYNLNDLKLKEFDRIQEMFDRAFRRVNTFEDFRQELVERKEKRARTEHEQEITKKQKVEDDKEKAELKKIHKEGKKSYYQLVRANEKSQMYMIFSQILKSFVREDLEDLYKLVKARYGSTRPMENMDYLLWSDLKTMFEPHVEDEIWKMQQGYKVLEWKLYDSYGVYSLMMQSMQIYMLVEKKYPLTPPTLLMMLEKKLQIDYESEMAYQLCKLIKKQLKK